MRFLLVPVLLVSLGFQGNSEIEDIAVSLKAKSRDVRSKAIDNVSRMPTVPAQLVAPLEEYLSKEFAFVFDEVPVDPNEKLVDLEKQLKEIPLQGDEVTLSRIKSDPKKYIGKTFVMCGGVSIFNGGEGGYRNAGSTHYTLIFVEFNRKGEKGDATMLYISKAIGRGLADDLHKVKAEEKFALPVFRFMCKIYPNRVTKIDEAYKSIEIIDYQDLNEDQTDWQPWVFEALGKGFSSLFKAGQTGARAALTIMVDGPHREGSPQEIAAMVCGMSAAGELSKEAKKQISDTAMAMYQESKAKTVRVKLRKIADELKATPKPAKARR